MKGVVMGLAMTAAAVIGWVPAGDHADTVERAVDRAETSVLRAVDRAEERVEWVAERVAEVSHAREGAGARQEAPDFNWSGPMPSGGVLEIKGVNGGIVAERSSGSEVVVTARLRGRRSDPSTVHVEVVEHAGGLTFCAVYPSPDDERANVCAPGDGGRMNTRRNDVEVEFHVEVPAGVPFSGRTVNGDVGVRELASDVDVTTVNGDLEITTTGTAKGVTVNGSIAATMGRAPDGSGASFSTVNGSITLDVPDDIDAELDAHWLNGDLSTDLPLSLTGGFGRRSARGTLGSGGPLLELSTVNGSIRIR